MPAPLGGLETGVLAFEADAAVGFDRRSKADADTVGFRTGAGASCAFFARASDAFVGANRPDPGVLGRGAAVLDVELAVAAVRVAVGVFAPARVTRGLFAPVRGLSRTVDVFDVDDAPVCCGLSAVAVLLVVDATGRAGVPVG